MRNVALIPFAATAFLSRTLRKTKKKKKKISSPPGEEIELQDWMVWRKDKHCKLSDASMDSVAETSVMDFVQIKEKPKKNIDDEVNYDSVVMETIPEEPPETVKEIQEEDFEILGMTSESVSNESECSDEQNDLDEPQNDLSRISSPTTAPPQETAPELLSPPPPPPLLSPNGSDSSIDIVDGGAEEEDSDNSYDTDEQANMEERLRGGASITEEQLQNHQRRERLAKLYDQLPRNTPPTGRKTSRIPRKSKVSKSSTAEFLSDTTTAKNFLASRGVMDLSEGYRIRVKKLNAKVMQVVSKDPLKPGSGDSPFPQNILPPKVPRHPTFTRLTNVPLISKCDNIIKIPCGLPVMEETNSKDGEINDDATDPVWEQIESKLSQNPASKKEEAHQGNCKPTISIEDAITDLTINGKNQAKSQVHPKHHHSSQTRLNRGTEPKWGRNLRYKLGIPHSRALEKAEKKPSVNCHNTSVARCQNWPNVPLSSPEQINDSLPSPNLLRARWHRSDTQVSECRSDAEPSWLYNRRKAKSAARHEFPKSSTNYNSSSATSSDEFDNLSHHSERPHYYRNLWINSLSSYFIVELFTESGGAPWFEKHCGIRVGVGIVPLLLLLVCIFFVMYFMSDEIFARICPTYCPKLARVTSTSYTPWNWFYG